jgi:hypothetical protein
MPRSDHASDDVRELPSFEGLLHGGPPKDADVIIVEEGVAGSKPAVGRKRTRSQGAELDADVGASTVACHQLVLYSFSKFFQNKVGSKASRSAGCAGTQSALFSACIVQSAVAVAFTG